MVPVASDYHSKGGHSASLSHHTADENAKPMLSACQSVPMLQPDWSFV